MSEAIWSGGRYTLFMAGDPVMGPRFALTDDEYGSDLTPEELAELRDVLIRELGPGK